MKDKRRKLEEKIKEVEEKNIVYRRRLYARIGRKGKRYEEEKDRER